MGGGSSKNKKKAPVKTDPKKKEEKPTKNETQLKGSISTKPGNADIKTAADGAGVIVEEFNTEQFLQLRAGAGVFGGGDKSKNEEFGLSDILYGKDFSSDFKIHKELAQGFFGNVLLVQKIGTPVMLAAKQIDKKKLGKDGIKPFLEGIKNSLNHLNIVKIMAFYEDDKYFYVLSEFCQGNELWEFLAAEKEYNEKKKCALFEQIITAISFNHANKVVYRDLRPDNFLFADAGNTILQINDFKTWTVFKPSDGLYASSPELLPISVAPEVLKGKSDSKSDIWSCGIILHLLFSGSSPFKEIKPSDLKDHLLQLKEVKISKFDMAGVSDEGLALLRKLLDVSPEKRPSADEILKDPWFSKNRNADDTKAVAMPGYLKNMKNFYSTSKLQRGIWNMMANFNVLKEEKEKLLAAFRNSDSDKNGKISKEEFLKVYQASFGVNSSKPGSGDIFQNVDSNNDGFIDYQEFLKSSIERSKLLTVDNLLNVFKQMDKDNNGILALQEIEAIFFPSDKSGKISKNLWEEMIKGIDSNNDKQINFEEFKSMMTLMMKNDSLSSI